MLKSSNSVPVAPVKAWTSDIAASKSAAVLTAAAPIPTRGNVTPLVNVEPKALIPVPRPINLSPALLELSENVFNCCWMYNLYFQLLFGK